MTDSGKWQLLQNRVQLTCLFMILASLKYYFYHWRNRYHLLNGIREKLEYNLKDKKEQKSHCTVFCKMITRTVLVAD